MEGLQRALALLASPPAPQPAGPLPGVASSAPRREPHTGEPGPEPDARPEDSPPGSPARSAGVAAASHRAEDLIRLPLHPRIIAVQLSLPSLSLAYSTDGVPAPGGAARPRPSRRFSVKAAQRLDVTATLRGTALAASVQLGGLQVGLPAPAPAPSGAAPSVLELLRVLSLSSATVQLCRNVEGGLSVVAGVSGLRLHGSPELPGQFVMGGGDPVFPPQPSATGGAEPARAGANPPPSHGSHGRRRVADAEGRQAGGAARQRPAEVAARYWAAGVEPPPKPAEAAFRAMQRMSEGEWLAPPGAPSVDGGIVGSDVCSGGGVDVRLADVTIGAELVTALAAALAEPRAAATASDGGGGDAGSAAELPAAAPGVEEGGRSGSATEAAAGAGPSGGPVAAASGRDAGKSPFKLRLELRRCALLAVSASRTPFAAASGSHQLACAALLSLPAVRIASPLAPLPLAATPRGGAPRDGSDGEADGGGAATAALERAWSTGTSAGMDSELGAPYGHTVRLGTEVRLGGVVLYLADSPDSAFLSPVLRLPALRLEHATGQLAGTQHAQHAQHALLDVELAGAHVALQPQQAGVLHDLLQELTVPRAEDPSAAAARQPPAPAAAAGGGAAGPARAALPALPALRVRVTLESLTASLGVDALSEESTLLCWRGVTASAAAGSAAERAAATAELTWQSLAVWGLASRAQAAAFEAAAGEGEAWGEEEEEEDGEEPRARAPARLQARALPAMIGLAAAVRQWQVAAALEAAAAAPAVGSPVRPAALWREDASRAGRSSPAVARMAGGGDGAHGMPRRGSLARLLGGAGSTALTADGDAEVEFFSVSGGSDVDLDLDEAGFALDSAGAFAIEAGDGGGERPAQADGGAAQARRRADAPEWPRGGAGSPGPGAAAAPVLLAAVSGLSRPGAGGCLIAGECCIALRVLEPGQPPARAQHASWAGREGADGAAAATGVLDGEAEAKAGRRGRAAASAERGGEDEASARRTAESAGGRTAEAARAAVPLPHVELDAVGLQVRAASRLARKHVGLLNHRDA